MHKIVCITENLLNESFPESLLINGLPYCVLCHERNTRGGGCELFVNSCLYASRVMLPLNLADLEIVAVEIRTGRQPLIICCVYNPSGPNVFSIKAICDILHYLCIKFVVFVCWVILVCACLNIALQTMLTFQIRLCL